MDRAGQYRSEGTPCLPVDEPTPKKTAQRVCGQADIKISDGILPSEFFLSVLAVEASVFCAGASHRPRRSIPLGLSKRRDDAPA